MSGISRWAILGLLLTSSGCQGPATVDAGSRAVEPAPIAAQPPSTPISATKLTQGIPRTLVYDASTDALPLVIVQDAMPDCHCAGRSWWVRTYSGDAGGAPRREVRLVIDVSGYVAAAEEINHEERFEVVYTPPLVLIPENLPVQAHGGAAYAQSVMMVMHPLGDRSKVRDQGRVQNEIRYIGDEQIATGTGTCLARKVSSTLRADLSSAVEFTTSDRWLVDGIGMVCEHSRRETKVPGAKARETEVTLLLRSIEGQR